MRRVFAITATLLVALGGAAWAGGDKLQDAFIDASSVNGGSQGFTNGTSVGKVKSGKCSIQIQLKGLTGVSDGDVLICIGGAEVRALNLGNTAGPFGNSAIFRGVVKAGQLKIKGDLTTVGCGGMKSINWGGGTICYKPNANYTDLTNDLVNWKATCAASGGGPAPMVALVNPDATPSSDPAKVNFLGVCQGFNAGGGDRITPPASAEICRQGETNLAL